MSIIYVGIDNGVSGAIAYYNNDKMYIKELPIKNTQNYTKKVEFVNKIDLLRYFIQTYSYHTIHQFLFLVFTNGVENDVHTKSCMWMFIAALPIIPQTGKQPWCL